jgi:hypothetical protein
MAERSLDAGCLLGSGERRPAQPRCAKRLAEDGPFCALVTRSSGRASASWIRARCFGDMLGAGRRGKTRRTSRSCSASGISVIVLLALSDKGAPSFDHDLAAKLAALGAPDFACTPEHFPELMGTAIERGDVAR